MLSHLKQSDIEKIIAECETMIAKSSGGIIAAKNIPFEEISARNVVAETIAKLSPNALLELVALMWAGQHHTPFNETLNKARMSKDGNDVQYVVGKAMSLPTYLRAGLTAIKSN